MSAITGSDASSPQSVQTVLHVPPAGRIPSLSRTEGSEPDTSEAASTPEGPSRKIAIATPRSAVGGHNFRHDEVEGDVDAWIQEEQAAADVSIEYTQGELYEQDASQPSSPVVEHQSSPRYQYSSPKAVSNQYSTPGVARGRVLRQDSFNPALQDSPATALRDVTTSRQDIASMPFTPSPVGVSSKLSDASTPRALLDDAERRKNHVLAVLSSSGLPSRTLKTAVRGTPHPLRRVSAAPTYESIDEDTSLNTAYPKQATTPGSRSYLSLDRTQLSAANDSFVSIASSADLTSDRRATTIPNHLARGNTSFPTILLPTGATTASPGGSLKGVSDHRANGVKIHKHLNAMNKQLLDDNAGLAREAEAWRDETVRLLNLLRDNGVEVEEVDVAALARGGISRQDESRHFSHSPSGSSHHFNRSSQVISQLSGRRRSFQSGQTSAQDLLDGISPEEQAAILQEMSERLEQLEEAMNDKDQQIIELQEQLGANGADELQQRIDKLSDEIEEAEKIRVSLHSEFAFKTEQHAKRFGEICTGFEEQVKSLEGELSSSRNDVVRLRTEKNRAENLASAGGDEKEKEWRKQIQNLDLELNRAKEEVRVRSRDIERLEKANEQGSEEKRSLTIRVQKAEDHAQKLETIVADMEQRATEAGRSAAELEVLRTQLEEREETNGELERIHADQETELDRQHEEIQTLSGKIADLEAEIASSDREGLLKEIGNLRNDIRETDIDVANRGAELEALRMRLNAAENRSPSSTPEKTSGDNTVLVNLQDRLDEAYHEIGRLKHELHATPHRKTTLEVYEAKVVALEREKAVLTERLAGVKTPSGMQNAASPFKPTPFVHRAIASLKTPRTPGPLKDVGLAVPNWGLADDSAVLAQHNNWRCQ